MAEYDRYSEFRSNGYVKSSPCVKIPVKSTDKYENYTSGFTRFDILRQQKNIFFAQSLNR